MTNKKWRVERYDKYWFVNPPRERDGCYWITWQPSEGRKLWAPTFRTHAEAMDYADRRARTVEVTLPPHIAEKTIPTLVEDWWAQDIQVDDYDTGHSWIIQHGRDECPECGADGADRIIVLGDQREAVAAHLLAHHYRKARA